MKVFYNILNESELVNLKTLPTLYKNCKKNSSYFLSRKSLTKLLNEVSNTEFDFITLQLQNYNSISQATTQTFSVSHNNTDAFTAMGDKSSFLGLGVDIESKQRTIKEKSTKYFINDQDAPSLDLDTLQLWCIKEACFKALANAGTGITLLKEVVITGNQFHYINKKTDSNNRFTILPHSDFILVLAYCSHENSKIEFEQV